MSANPPLTLYGIPNCDTVKKARGWLDARGLVHAFHDYKKVGIDADTLGRWADAAGWEPLLNRAGTTFRKLAEHEKTDLTRTKAIDLMLSHPSLIKRPVVEGAGALLIGFKEAEWAARFA